MCLNGDLMPSFIALNDKPRVKSPLEDVTG